VIAGAEAVRSLPEKVGTMVLTLRAGRELARVEPEQRAGVVQAILDEGIPVAAAAILAAFTAASKWQQLLSLSRDSIKCHPSVTSRP
jgi:hypothetical protein